MPVSECHPSVPAAAAPLVRPAGRTDHDAIREVLLAAYGQYVIHFPAQVWGSYLADLLDLDRHAREGQLLVAVVGGEVAGCATVYPDASVQGLGWPAGWAGGRGLAVRPARRGHGVASALLAAMEQWAHAEGAPVFAVHTAPFMTTAVALYERRGYRRAPEFDLDVASHYDTAHDDIAATLSLTAIAYLRPLPVPGAGAGNGRGRPDHPHRRGSQACPPDPTYCCPSPCRWTAASTTGRRGG